MKMSEYVNPDYPTPGTSMFLKPQVNEIPDPGFYYAGGAINPFNQPMMGGYMNNGQPSMGDSRRFFPDMNATPIQGQPNGLNAFVEMNRRQMNAPQPPMMPQPPQVSPWMQMTNQPMAPMNNNNMFMTQYVDPLSFRPYGNYSDMAHGQLVPPINKKMMWDEARTPNMVYDTPTINWNALTPQYPTQQMYNPATPQQMNYSAYAAPSVFVDDNRPVSWDERARSNWK